MYPHLAAKLFSRPLLLHPPVLRSFGTQLANRIAGRAITPSGNPQSAIRNPQSSASFFRDCAPRVQQCCDQAGDIAIICISGVIDKAITQMDMECYGGCDLRDIDCAIACAKNDPSINRIVLHIDTPGGSVVGVPETAARIADLALTKEVHAYIDTQCCSAGMWLASQADLIVATPSSILGSIGVFFCCVDESKALAEEGINVQVIEAGQFKTMGASYRALTGEEIDMLQAEANRIHTDFKAAITATRQIDDATMQGQSFPASQALSLKLCDQLTNDDLDEYVTSLLLS